MIFLIGWDKKYIIESDILRIIKFTEHLNGELFNFIKILIVLFNLTLSYTKVQLYISYTKGYEEKQKRLKMKILRRIHGSISNSVEQK